MEDLHNLGILWNRRKNEWVVKNKVDFFEQHKVQQVNVQGAKQADFYNEILNYTHDISSMADNIISTGDFHYHGWLREDKVFDVQITPRIKFKHTIEMDRSYGYMLYLDDKLVLSVFKKNADYETLPFSFVGLDMVVMIQDKPVHYNCDVLVDDRLSLQMKCFNQHFNNVYVYAYSDIEDIRLAMNEYKRYYTTL